MCAGGVLAYLVLIPAIKFFGDGARPGVARAGHHADLPRWRPTHIRGAYVLYIGAGAVAAGGIISLVRSLPHDLARPPTAASRDFRGGAGGAGRRPCRAPTATCR